MKIVVNKKHVTKEEIEVVFPIYRQLDFDSGGAIYTKINEDLTAVHVNMSNRSLEIEAEERYNFGEASSTDYHLGFGEYSSSESAFNRAFEKATAYMKRASEIARGSE